MKKNVKNRKNMTWIKNVKNVYYIYDWNNELTYLQVRATSMLVVVAVMWLALTTPFTLVAILAVRETEKFIIHIGHL